MCFPHIFLYINRKTIFLRYEVLVEHQQIVLLVIEKTPKFKVSTNNFFRVWQNSCVFM